MAKQTMEKKFAAAKKKYEAELKILGKQLQEGLAAELVEVIPEGWYLVWNQSDEQYNDEDYYFGLEGKMLCSVLVPRQGKVLKEEFTRAEKRSRYNTATGRYEDVEEPVTYEAEYEWILDDECKKLRKPTDKEEDTPGVIPLYDGGRYAKPDVTGSVTKTMLKDLCKVMDSIDDEDYRRAFGDQATVRIYSDGTVEVD